MKKFRILLLALIAVFLVSCLGGKKAAKRKIAKKMSQIEALVKKYPELSDTIFKVSHDTIFIVSESDSATFDLATDTMYVDSALAVYIKSYQEMTRLEKKRDSILSITNLELLGDSLTSSQKSSEADGEGRVDAVRTGSSKNLSGRSNIITLQQQARNRRYEAQLRSIEKRRAEAEQKLKQTKIELANRFYSAQNFTYEDSAITAEIIIIDGKLNFKYKIPEKSVAYERSRTVIQMDNTRTGNFWEDWKFLVFLVFLIIILIYMYSRSRN